MGSKEAPLGNVSAKTYLLKAILKVIKKIKFSRRKPEAFFPHSNLQEKLHKHSSKSSRFAPVIHEQTAWLCG